MLQKTFTAMILSFLLFGFNSVASAKNISNKAIEQPKEEIVVVSLGSHCQSSLILRELGMRQFATPLDWLLSLDHKGLIKLINDEFRYMFDIKYLIQYPEGYVINTLYNLELRHEWSSLDFHKTLPDIASKYERRIERFFCLPQIAKRVVFVRTVFDPKLNVANNMPTYNPACTVISAQQAQELYNCLKQKFPDLQFILAVVNFSHTNSGITQDMNGILEFKVNNLIDDYKKFVPLLGNLKFFETNYHM